MRLFPGPPIPRLGLERLLQLVGRAHDLPAQHFTVGHRIGQGWSVLSPAGSQMRALKQGPTLWFVEFASAPGTVAHLLQANLGVVLCRPMFRNPQFGVYYEVTA